MIKFKQFYQGWCTEPHAYAEGQEVSLDKDVEKYLIEQGVAEDAKPKVTRKVPKTDSK